MQRLDGVQPRGYHSLLRTAPDRPAKETQTPDIDGEQTEAGEYRRIANIGSQQLQARVVTPYYGLSIDDIIHGTTVFR